ACCAGRNPDSIGALVGFQGGGPVAEGQKKAVRGKCRFCTATVSSFLVQEVPLIRGSLRLSWAIKKGVRKEGRLAPQNQCLFSRNSSIIKELRYCWRTLSLSLSVS